MLCVCPSAEPRDPAGDKHSANLVGGGREEGVLARFQAGRLAEATWD
jgi:hypothetical protein